jgi:mono/diheme cytochrome c family protein
MKRTISLGRERSAHFIQAITAVVAIFANIALATPQENPASGVKWKNGAEVYAKICGYCHEDGKVGPRILNRQLPPAYIRAVVRNGNRAMPSFRFSEIDEESLARLAEYISKSQNAR